MRALLSGERTTIAQQSITFRAYVEVENVDGSWVNLTSRFVSADVTTDVDQPVWSAVIAFARDDAANTASLSPLRSDSTLNVDDAAAYAPLLTAGHEIKVWVATVGPSVTPAYPADYRMLFHGRIDKPNFGQTPMTVECRDLGGMLIDTYIDAERDYGDADDPVPVADVMQQILDDVLGENAPTLVDDLSSDFVVTSYKPRNIPLMEAMTSLAIKAGGAVARYRFQADGTMALTLYDPVREKTTPDATIPPTEYLEVPDASIDSTNVRNRIRGQFIDPVTGELLTLEVEDTDSQAAGFGVRFMQLGADVFEGLTGNKVLEVITSALTDLAYPKFDKVVECLLFWPAEIADLYRFSANAVHYDSAQDLAVMGIAHHLENGHGTTRFTCRGTPAGAYLDWIRRQGTGPTGPLVPPAPELMFLVGEATQYGGTAATVDGALWLGYRMPKGVDEIRVHALLGDGPDIPAPPVESSTWALTIRRPEGDIGRGTVGGNRYPNDPGEYSSLAILSTRSAGPATWKRVTFYGVRGGLTSEAVIPNAVEAVDPSPSRIDGTIASLVVTRADTSNTVTVTPGTLEDTDDTVNGNWVCIVRNGHILPPFYVKADTTPVVFEDTGLEPEFARNASYEAFIFNGGQSGPKRRVAEIAAAPVAPVFALGTPAPAIQGGAQKIQISWTGATAGATTVDVQATLDGLAVRLVGSGALASGTVYDANLADKRYRLVARNILGVALAYSPWKWSTRFPPTISAPSVAPKILDGYPRPGFAPGSNVFNPTFVLVLKWTNARAGTVWIRIQESDDNGVSDPWALVTNGETTGSSGTWYSPDDTAVGQDKWYRILAIAADGTTVLATSIAVHYVPKSA